MSIRPITDTLRLLQGGAFLPEASAKFAEVIKGVDETGKAGKLTITIDVKKVGAAVSLLAKVTDKTPEEAADPDMFWPTVEGNVSLQNPNQRSLDLKAVETSATEVKNIDPSTGEIRFAG